ncbi:retrovirus-related Pol polyprotein from transposon 412 [Trichonephila clavipes]|nr:retrovirus-related Pol polyprotein from transposon 412 [Trichonephila clavipes]
MKTWQKVRERFYWNNVRSDVEKCCDTCDPCDARKTPRKRTRGRVQLYNVGAPFERIAFDILGPLPRLSEGNNNILVFMDYFTKWPEAYPIPDQEASTVAEVLDQHWISRFGVPLQLHSDQGRNFDSAVCKRLCEILAIDKTRTTALHPQSDGMVERFNRTILNSLSLLVSSNQQDWDKKLLFFLLAYRSAVHETTSYSPSPMLFGCDLRLPADLLFSRPPDAPLAPEEYVEKLQARIEEIHHLARERNGLASEKMKTRYDARATRHDFHEDDKVWLWNPKRRKGLSPKLQTNWEGPYTVLKILNDVVVRIQKSPHSKNRRGSKKGLRGRSRRNLLSICNWCKCRVHQRRRSPLGVTTLHHVYRSTKKKGCGSPVVKSNHGRHVMSSIPVPLKTRRVGQRCTLNLSRAETSSRWCGVVVRRGGASSGVVHVT